VDVISREGTTEEKRNIFVASASDGVVLYRRLREFIATLVSRRENDWSPSPSGDEDIRGEPR
jgi:hypothetical protein